jgi:hypothetical protein
MMVPEADQVKISICPGVSTMTCLWPQYDGGLDTLTQGPSEGQAGLTRLWWNALR